MEIRVHLNSVNLGFPTKTDYSNLDITKRYYSNLLLKDMSQLTAMAQPWLGTLLLISKVMNDNAGYLCVLSSVISLDCLGTTMNTYQFDIRPSNVDQAI